MDATKMDTNEVDEEPLCLRTYRGMQALLGLLAGNAGKSTEIYVIGVLAEHITHEMVDLRAIGTVPPDPTIH